LFQVHLTHITHNNTEFARLPGAGHHGVARRGTAHVGRGVLGDPSAGPRSTLPRAVAREAHPRIIVVARRPPLTRVPRQRVGVGVVKLEINVDGVVERKPIVEDVKIRLERRLVGDSLVIRPVEVVFVDANDAVGARLERRVEP